MASLIVPRRALEPLHGRAGGAARGTGASDSCRGAAKWPLPPPPTAAEGNDDEAEPIYLEAFNGSGWGSLKRRLSETRALVLFAAETG